MRAILLAIISTATAAICGCGNYIDEGYVVDELADKAVAQKEAFMGKEVLVSGYVSNVSSDLDNDGYALGLDFDLYSPIERQLACAVPHGQAPENIRSKWVTVKGKIVNIHSQTYMDLKSIKLDPCEITDYK